MRPTRAPGRLARASEVRALSTGLLFTAAVCALTALVPFSPTAPRALDAALGVLAAALGVWLRLRTARTRVAHVHGVLVVGSVGMTVCVGASTTEAGPAVTALGFVWLAVFVAAFETRRALAAHLVLVAVGLRVGLAAADAPSAWPTWTFLVLTASGVGWVLNEKVTRLRLDATHDALTGAFSRRAFLALAGQELARAARDGRPLTLVLLDLDGFKQVNDVHGHAAGDETLVQTARTWAGVLRAGDVLGRLGGDEFALLLPSTDEEGARRLLERLSVGARIGWSAGVARWRGEDVEAWMHAADTALYAEKRGRTALRHTASGPS